MMRTFVLSLLTLIIFSFKLPIAYSQSPAPTIDYTLPYPGILPDHPLYKLKSIRDSLLLFFTRNPSKKAETYLLISDKKVKMSQLLWEKGDTNLSLATLMNSQQNLMSGFLVLSDLNKAKSAPPDLTDRYRQASLKHEEIISQIKAATRAADSSRLDEIISLNHQVQEHLTKKTP